MVSVKCIECGKQYELLEGENPSNFQCQCGGSLEYAKNNNKNVIINFWNKQSKNNKIVIIGALIFLIVLTSYLSYDYINPNLPKDEKNFINAVESGKYSKDELIKYANELTDEQKEFELELFSMDKDVLDHNNVNGLITTIEYNNYLLELQNAYDKKINMLTAIGEARNNYINGLITKDNYIKQIKEYYALFK